MRTENRLAILFPGQGAYYKGALSESYKIYPQVKEVFTEIDAAANRYLNVSIRDVFFGAAPPSVEQLRSSPPELLQLGMYGISVATYKILEGQGLYPSIFVGHSFGEIAALVCSETFTVAEGAKIVYHRSTALKVAADREGYMIALATDPDQAAKIVDLVGRPADIAVAVKNFDKQTVVSGAKESMDKVASLAAALGVQFIRVESPFAFHSPLMQPVVEEFINRIRHITQRPMKSKVYSPILHRYYSDGDDLTLCLAEHLVMPVDFPSAVRHLVDEQGIRLFVESGALATLSKLVKKIVRSDEVTTVASLDPTMGDSASLQRAIQVLRAHGAIEQPDDGNIAQLLFPGIDKNVFSAFWSRYGKDIIDFANQKFAHFKQAGDELIGQAAPAVEPAIPVASPVVVAAAVAVTLPASSSVLSRDELFNVLRTMFAQALEYPEEVFTPEVELEADLGIDSLKQTELLAQARTKYQLLPPPEDVRLGDYKTMDRIVDYVYSLLPKPTASNASHASAPVPEVMAAPVYTPVGAGMSRDELFNALRTIFAQALEYPEEVFTPEVELEADLGIDSLKQTELLAQARTKYQLLPPPEDVRLGDYKTMDRIVDYVYSLLPKTTPTVSVTSQAKPKTTTPPIEPASVHASAPAGAGMSRDELFNALRTMFAQALEYPEEVFTPEVELEADLGIDSLKQTELLAQARTKYQLLPPPEDVRLGDYKTMDRIIDYVYSLLPKESAKVGVS